MRDARCPSLERETKDSAREIREYFIPDVQQLEGARLVSRGVR